jgi:hypothetical protein
VAFSFRFPHQNPLYISTLPHTCYMARPPRSLFDHPRVHNYIHLRNCCFSSLWCQVLMQLYNK